MILKTKYCLLEIEVGLIFIIITSLISNTLFKFLYFFFACYLFIIFHELMHIVIGNLLNKKLIKIKLSLAGICATFEREKSNYNNKEYFKNIIIYLAGPISNLLLAYIFRSNTMIKEINLFLAFLNMIPIFPLDGYNIILNILSICFRKEKTGKIVDIIGFICVIILLLLAIFQIIIYKNISLIIFSLYILILKINKNNKY